MSTAITRRNMPLTANSLLTSKLSILKRPYAMLDSVLMRYSLLVMFAMTDSTICNKEPSPSTLKTASLPARCSACSSASSRRSTVTAREP